MLISEGAEQPHPYHSGCQRYQESQYPVSKAAGRSDQEAGYPGTLGLLCHLPPASFHYFSSVQIPVLVCLCFFF